MKKNIYTLLICTLLLGLPLMSQAQLSLETGATWNRYMGQPGSDPALYGFNLRVGSDFGERSQVMLGYTWHSQYTWQRLDVPVHELQWKVPEKVKDPGKNTFREMDIDYTYYFSGDNVTFTSYYATVGPAIMFRTASEDPQGAVLQKQNDWHLDMRLGAAAHVGIGWLYLEGRVAPRMFSTRYNGGIDKLKGPLYGLNAGIRFLLNRHPRCAY